MPPSRRWQTQLIRTEERLDRAFIELEGEEALMIVEALGYLCNLVFSADQIPFWDHKAQEKTLHLVRSCLTLALEMINGNQVDPQTDATTLRTIHINVLF